MSYIKKSAFLATAILLNLSNILYSHVTFDAESKVTNVAFGAKEACWEFVCKNSGDQELRITEIATECGCMSSSYSNSSLKPGDSINIAFKLLLLPSTNTMREQHAVVKTSDGEKHILTIVADLAKAFSVSPRMLIWQRDSLDTLTITITSTNIEQVKLGGFIGNDPSKFKIDITSDLKRNLYQIEVTPLTTKNPTKLTLRPIINGVESLWQNTYIYLITK